MDPGRSQRLSDSRAGPGRPHSGIEDPAGHGGRSEPQIPLALQPGHHLANGTRSYSWIHVTGNQASKRAFLTEGPLKGDVASFLADDALFVCTGGVNAIHGLKQTLQALNVTEVVEAMDMDQMTNPHVRQAIQAMRKEVQSIPGLRYSKYTWNPAYKGVDDYLLSRRAG